MVVQGPSYLSLSHQDGQCSVQHPGIRLMSWAAQVGELLLPDLVKAQVQVFG